MVCVPCFIVPVLLFLWHRFIQPYVLRFWNPWAVKDADGNVVRTETPFDCKEGVCVFGKKKLDQEPKIETGEQKDESTKECPNQRIKAE